MKNQLGILVIVILLSFLIGIVVERNIISKNYNDTVRVVSIDTIWRTNTITKVINDVKVRDSIVYNTDTILLPFDSVELVNRYKDIIKKYFSEIYYSDTFTGKNDSLFLNESISKNRIVSRSYIFKEHTLIIDSTINNIIYREPAAIYGSLILGNNIIAPTVFIKWNKYSAGLGYDIKNKNININLSYKIWELQH